MCNANGHYWNTLQIPRTSLLLTLLREEKTNKQWLLAIHTVVGKVVYYLAIGLMVILAGVNFYVHLLAPYTIQSSITLINKHRQSLDYIEHEGYERFVFNLYHFKV